MRIIHVVVCLSAPVVALMVHNAEAQEAASLRRPADTKPPPLAAVPGPAVGARKLAPIVISPEISVQSAAQGTNLVPSVHGDGERFLFGDASSSLTSVMQFRLDFRPSAIAGKSDQVADQLRALNGNFAGNLALKLSWFPSAANKADDDGSFGADLRVALNGALATTSTVNPSAITSPDTVLSRNTFGLGTIESSLSVWLFWMYVGAQYSKYAVLGDGVDQVLADDLNKRAGLAGILVVPFKLGTVTDATGATKSQMLYLQAKVNARSDFSNAIWTVGVAGAFSPL